MIIAAAQTKPFDNNTEQNIQEHFRLIELAAKKEVQLIVFPEMSLTGYQRELADELAFSENDLRLDAFKEKAVFNKMIIVAGAPIKINSQLHIGSFIFLPDNTVSIYTKQFLHQGEEYFFSPNFNCNPTIELDNEVISLAICADIANPIHPQNAYKNKTTLYLASIFYTPNGIAEAYQQLSDYARKYSMKILMANYGGPSYQYESAGQSAFWNNNGELTCKIEKQTEELLVVQT
jgi:predicted amidohydrolase